MSESVSIQRVMVTGANSFYAAAVINLLLSRGIAVHGTVRTVAHQKRLTEKYGESVKVFVVPDITVPGAFDEAVKTCDGIFHIASPINFNFADVKRDMIDPAVEGALEALRSATTEPRVRRVVMTSSVAAVLDPFVPGGSLRPGYVYTEADFNPVTMEQAITLTVPALVYVSSKALAERAAWDFIKADTRHFDLISINPAHTWGHYHQTVTSPSEMNLTNSDLSRLMDGHHKVLPPVGLPWMADIDAVAQAHVNAMFTPSANGRYIIANSFYTFEQVSDIMHDNFPDAEWIGNVPKADKETQVMNSADCFKFDNTRARDELHVEFRPIERPIIDFCTQYQSDRKAFRS